MRGIRSMLMSVVALHSGFLSAEPDTFIQYKFQSPSTVFDTRYSLAPTGAETFLLDVAAQRSLGTFQKSSVASTDEFIPAINKRLAEFQQVSADLKKTADSPLPVPAIQAIHITSLDEIIALPGTKVPVAIDNDHDMQNRIAEIRKFLEGDDISLGFKNFVAIEQLIQGSPSNSRLRKFSNDLYRMRLDFFTPAGILKGQSLTSISQGFKAGISKDGFIAAMVNSCIASPKCDQEKFRPIAATMMLFGGIKEVITIRTSLNNSAYDVNANSDLKSIVGNLIAIKELAGICADAKACEDSKQFLKVSSQGWFKCSESQTNEIMNLIYN